MRVGIVGSGMSGLCMGATLRRAGIEDFTIYEKADEVGGTWRDNTYPGVSCDVPSRYYSYSFAPGRGWTHRFAPGHEIRRYLNDVASDLGLRPHLRFGAEVTAARWTGEAWRLSLADGTSDTVGVLVTATGVLHHPRLPDIPGLETFGGAAFHSARWDHGAALDGRRVAVIGTGSTGVQLTTALAGRAGRLLVFQRTPQWLFPMPDARVSRLGRLLYGRFPALSRLSHHLNRKMLENTLGHAVIEPGIRRRMVAGLCRLHLRLGVRDPALRRRLTPQTEPMCRRLVMSAGFYRAIQHPAVDLVTDPIDHIEPRGIVTRDGTLHEVDVIALATGFDAHAYFRPLELVGADGLSIERAWAEGPRAYRSVALAGFPNFFMLMGPHSPIGNHSLIDVAETQAGYIVRWIERIRSERIRSGASTATAPTAEATDRFNREMRESMSRTVWTTGCQSWYLGPDGVPELWPWSAARHREMLREPQVGDFTQYR